MIDKGKELLVDFVIIMANDHEIPCNAICSRNPQADVIVQREYQIISNFIRTSKIQQMDLDNEIHWEGILSSTMFSILSTVYSATHYTPYIITTSIWYGRSPNH